MKSNWIVIPAKLTDGSYTFALVHDVTDNRIEIECIDEASAYSLLDYLNNADDYQAPTLTS